MRWGRAISLLAMVLGGCGGGTGATANRAPLDGGVTEDAPADAGSDGGGSFPLLQVRLDPSFGMQGAIDGQLARWIPAGVAIDPQGRILVAGPGQDPSGSVMEVVRRFAADGSDDRAFGASGQVTIAFDSFELAQATRSLPDGRIGVLGAVGLDGGTAAFAIRLAADGSSDPAFVGSPLFVSSIGSFNAGLWQDDGSGFLFGSSGVVRFDADGDIDPAYDAGINAPAQAGALAPDGRFWTATGSRVSRYLPGGAFDASFGQGGSIDLALSDASAGTPTVQTLLPGPTGTALVIASHPTDGAFDIDVARLTKSGILDHSYGGGQFVSVPTSGGPVGAAQLADGRVIVWSSHGELVSIEPDGTPQDAGFLDVPGTVLGATLDALQRLVVIGIATEDPMNMRWLVRRYWLL
jgi:uncharacterized delta-60 repeat protein